MEAPNFTLLFHEKTTKDFHRPESNFVLIHPQLSSYQRNKYKVCFDQCTRKIIILVLFKVVSFILVQLITYSVSSNSFSLVDDFKSLRHEADFFGLTPLGDIEKKIQ